MAKGILVIVIFIVFAFVSLFCFPGAEDKPLSEAEIINATKEDITDYVNKKMYAEAVSLYGSLAAAFPANIELGSEYAVFCEENGYRSNAVSEYLAILEVDSQNSAAAQRLLEIYNEDKNFSALYEFTDKYKDILSDAQIYKEITKNGSENFKTLTTGFSDIKDWSRGDYSFATNSDRKKGVVSSKGNYIVSAKYDDIMSFSANELLIGVNDDGQLVYTNADGFRKRVPYNNEKNELIYPQYIGPFENGCANVCLDDKWGYCTSDMKYGYVQYEYASAFSDGVSAVKTAGKWGLLNLAFNEILPASYDEIYVDEYGYCAENGMMFIKNGVWELYRIVYDENGYAASLEKCSEQTFDEVSSFGTCGAVKKNGKWGFIRASGDWLIEPSYDGAKSFRSGIGAVKKNGKWIFINSDGEKINIDTYDDVTAFSDNGCAGVKNGDIWTMVQIEKYYYSN